MMNLTFLLLLVKFLLLLYFKNCGSTKFGYVADSVTFKIDEFIVFILDPLEDMKLRVY